MAEVVAFVVDVARAHAPAAGLTVQDALATHQTGSPVEQALLAMGHIT